MASSLELFLKSNSAMILVEVASIRGSTPRDAGTFMLVSATGTAGTIGGGQLEYMAIDHARLMLSARTEITSLDIPLGPEIGQCCGGRAALSFAIVTDIVRAEIAARLAAEKTAEPHVFVFGAGHVGKAIAQAFALLPFAVTVVETRENELEGLPQGITPRLFAMPEMLVADIPSGSAVLILTHDHALDFLIAAEALKRSDLAYIGMIGSATKRAVFRNWLQHEAPEADLTRLTLPVGGPLKDKRPAVIAALTAAEILATFANAETCMKKTICSANSASY